MIDTTTTLNVTLHGHEIQAFMVALQTAYYAAEEKAKLAIPQAPAMGVDDQPDDCPAALDMVQSASALLVLSAVSDFRRAIKKTESGPDSSTTIPFTYALSDEDEDEDTLTLHLSGCMGALDSSLVQMIFCANQVAGADVATMKMLDRM